MLARVVYICGSDVELKYIDKPNCAYEQGLLITQALATSKTLSADGKLIFITCGAQWVNDAQTKYSLSQAPLIGLGRVIAIEHPELHSRIVDLDVDVDADDLN